jgi:hypothetical protein
MGGPFVLNVAWTDALEPDDVRTRDGGDPLGFRAYANRLAREIVPGLTQATAMTRGFGLLCLALDVAMSQNPINEAAVRERFLRVERIWVAAEALRTNGEGWFPGKRRAWRLVQGVAEYPVNLPILDEQLSSGIWGAYRRSSSAFGLIYGAGGRVVRLSETVLTPSGHQLANALRTNAGGHVQLGHWATESNRTVPVSTLGLVEAEPGPTEQETALLSHGMASYDARHEQALSHLRVAYEQQDELDLKTIDLAVLSGRQRRAVEVARSLVAVIEAVEKPFRHWVATGKRSQIPKSVWSAEIWKAAKVDGETALMHLHDLAVDAPAAKALDIVLGHHRWLARERGAPQWAPGDGREAALVNEAPTFTLRAAKSLFDEGVAPHAGA